MGKRSEQIDVEDVQMTNKLNTVNHQGYAKQKYNEIPLLTCEDASI